MSDLKQQENLYLLHSLSVEKEETKEQIEFTPIDWCAVDFAVDRIVDWFIQEQIQVDAIYGIPRGGLILAVMLSHALDIPLTTQPEKLYDKPLLIVDDVADTGQTLLPFQNGTNFIVTMHYHQQSIIIPDCWFLEKFDRWIVYPWE